MTSAGCSANLRPNSMQPGSGRRFSWLEAPRLRVEADAEDIALLYHEVGYHTVEEGRSRRTELSGTADRGKGTVPARGDRRIARCGVIVLV